MSDQIKQPLEPQTLAERAMRLEGRAKSIGDLPILSQPNEARKLVASAMALLVEMAHELEDLQPYSDMDERDGK